MMRISACSVIVCTPGLLRMTIPIVLSLHIREIRLRKLDLRSAELFEKWLESSAEGGIPFLYFNNQIPGRHSESAAQLLLIERADKGVCERTGQSGREAIDTTSIESTLSIAEASQREYVVANRADPVFGLPGFVALDARAGVQDVVPAQPDKVERIGLWSILTLPGEAEERMEVWAARAKILRRCHRYVYLQAIW